MSQDYPVPRAGSEEAELVFVINLKGRTVVPGLMESHAFFESVSDELAGPVTVGADGSITSGGQSNRALYHLRVRQTFEGKKRSTLDAMAFSGQVGLTTNLDQVLPPSPGPLHPGQSLSNLDHFRMYDAWLALHREGRTFIRLQFWPTDHRGPADQPPGGPQRLHPRQRLVPRR